MYFYNARWYDPQMRRFVQADTIVPAPGNPQTLNRYAYALNNPVRYNDPTGHYVFEQGPSDTWIFGNGQVRSHDYWTHPEGGGFQPVSDAEVLMAVTSPFWAALAVTGVIGAGEAVIAGGTAAVATIKAAAESAFGYAVADGDPTDEIRAVVDTLAADGDPTNEVNTGSNVVYAYVKDGITKYVGITKDYVRRAYEHGRKGWNIEPIEGLENLSRYDARAVEQCLIEHYGLDSLENVINSIASKNPIYYEAIQRGRDILEQIGFYAE